MSERAKYTVYAVDRAGNSWDEAMTDDPKEALRQLERVRATYPTGGVTLTDDPEAGDVENRIMEELGR